MASRPLEIEEYKAIVNLVLSGFKTLENRVLRPNKQIALAFQLQASLGLRIGDILSLQVNNFKNGKLEIRERKTNKLQYREINRDVYDYIKDYAIEKKLSPYDRLFSIGVRQVQKQLKIIRDYLKLDNISTHSFRKMYATIAYEDSGHNLELIKELLNHTSIATTQKYIRVSQQTIDLASAKMNFLIIN
jgi:integrase